MQDFVKLSKSQRSLLVQKIFFRMRLVMDGMSEAHNMAHEQSPLALNLPKEKVG